MLLIKKFLPIIVIILPVVAFTQNCMTLDTLNWMLGEWQQDGDKVLTTEIWKKISSNTFEGISTNLRKSENKITFVETLRIVEMSGKIYYLAKTPQNEFPVPFKLTESSDSTAIFENIGHDFPQKIFYLLSEDGQRLTATVSNTERQFKVEYKKMDEE